MKEFAVIGLGNFGATVATELVHLKCHVTAIDIDKTKIQKIESSTSLGIIGDATDRDFLKNLDVGQFDCFIISTGQDSHASILITLYLKEMNARKIIVKANSEDHARILRKVGADITVIPEQEMAIRLALAQSESDLIDYLPLTGDYCVAELSPPKTFIGKTLMQLKLRKKHNIQIVAVKDTVTNQFNFAPDADYEIKAADMLIALGKRSDIDKLKK